MRVSIPVWFEVESLEDEVPTEEMSPHEAENAADLAATHHLGMILESTQGALAPDDTVTVHVDGLGEAQVKLLGINPD